MIDQLKVNAALDAVILDFIAWQTRNLRPGHKPKHCFYTYRRETE